MKCSDCRYFQEFKEPRSADDPADGFCRARSPRVFPDMEDSGYLTLSPVVDESYWCGEFRERENLSAAEQAPDEATGYSGIIPGRNAKPIPAKREDERYVDFVKMVPIRTQGGVEHRLETDPIVCICTANPADDIVARNRKRKDCPWTGHTPRETETGASK